MIRKYAKLLLESLEEQPPENFYLLFCLSKGLKGGLYEGMMRGVKGVLGTIQYETEGWVQCNNEQDWAKLIMPGPETAAANQLDKIHYRDNDDLLANNMRKALRVDGMDLWLRYIPEYFEEAFKKHGIDNDLAMRAVKRIHDANFGRETLYHYKINSTGDFSDALYAEYMENIENMVVNGDLEEDEEADDIIAQFVRIVAGYRAPYDDYEWNEQEWIVLNEILVIPDGSTLVVSDWAISNLKKDIMERLRARYNVISRSDH